MIDSHCHLADAVFGADLPDVVARARAAGLDTALCIISADEPEERARAADVRAAWPAVRFAVGIHPHRAAPYGDRLDEATRVVREGARALEAAAIGEIGLDYHYDFAPRAVQRDVFAAQLELAVELDLPVVIHTREASADTFTVLREVEPAVRGVMHCFTGTPDEARTALDLGFYLSFSGIVTFNGASALRALAASVPADRILVETDAPYLAPVPHRGTRNEPARVRRTLEAVATARGADPEALASQIGANFAQLLRPARPELPPAR
jgi:TatD DNase family protein